MTVHTLARDGVGLAVEVSDVDELPKLIHWGADPGTVTAAYPALSLIPVQNNGWMGRPGLSGDRSGRLPHPRLRLAEPVTVGPHSIRVHAVDEGLALAYELELTEQGVIRIRSTVTNTGADEYTMAALRCLLPIPGEATEALDLTGRWALERMPQRHDFGLGSLVRESRRGRTGHDSTTLLFLGTKGFSHRAGQVWAVHVGWSGNHEHMAERMPDSFGCLGGGELLGPGEIRLAPGERYRTPWVYFVWSGSGLDGVRDRLHRYLRARPGHPSSPRPVVLNTWEAVYFQHDWAKLTALADTAAAVGVERFVLDDGWFGARRDDRAALGDWYVSPDVWPDGLRPLADHVRGLGMRFGLWFEPEMVNPDSDLFRAHPEWVLAEPGRLPAEQRHQHVLDLTRAPVREYLLDRFENLLTEIGVDFIKWDHNRDLAEAPRVHGQTQAVYGLLDELRRRHPALEIESCSSGGARIDLGILERTDRVWTSDTNDPVDRQAIQLWTSLLLPPELMGAHVGPARAHITGRVTDLRFRCATALFGHAGIECDLTELSPEDQDVIRDWITLYKRTRGLLHSGRMVVPDPPDGSAMVHGVVSADLTHAMFSYAQLASMPGQTPSLESAMRLRLPGLHPDLDYRAEVAWGRAAESRVITGRALEVIGLPVPRLNPAQALILEFTAT